MVVRELVVALLECRDQEAKVFNGDGEVTSCDEYIWDEGENKKCGKKLCNRVVLSSAYEEGVYGKVA